MKIKKWVWLLLAGFLLLPLSLEGAEVGEVAPAFELTTLDGIEIDSRELVGQKSLLLAFWATWCPACKGEIPRINELAREYIPRGMEFIGVNVGINDSLEKVQRFREKYQMYYPIFFDEGFQLSKEFRIVGTPTVVIVDKKGVVRYRGVSPPSDLQPYLAE